MLEYQSQERCNKMKYSRNKLQELTMLCIYQYLFYYESKTRPTIKELIEDIFNQSFEECDPFVKKLLKVTIENANTSVIEISKCLKDWTFDRLNLVEQAILLFSYSQFKYMEQPKEVCIDVAVDLTKKFSSEDAYKYIKGVLDKCLV